MTSEELKKYVSFRINTLAFLPLPENEEDNRDNNNYYFNEATKEYVGVAIRDDCIPFIENFKIEEN